MSSATELRTPENVPSSAYRPFSSGAQNRSCRRKLYTPRTKAARQIRGATRNVSQINTYLRQLDSQSSTAKRRGHSMLEYRIKLKVATAECVKCMYQEYIKRKSEELCQHSANACLQEFSMAEFASPPRSAAAATVTSGSDGAD